MNEQCYALYRVQFHEEKLIAVRRDRERAKAEAARLQSAEIELNNRILAEEPHPYWIESFSSVAPYPVLHWQDDTTHSRASGSPVATWLVKPYEI